MAVVRGESGSGTTSDPLVPHFALVGRPVSFTDISGTVTTGGTAQNAAAANATRRGLIIQNVSPGALYVSTTGTASATVSAGSGSIRIDAGAYWEAPAHGVPTGAVSVYGATTAQAWVGREW